MRVSWENMLGWEANFFEGWDFKIFLGLAKNFTPPQKNLAHLTPPPKYFAMPTPNFFHPIIKNFALHPKHFLSAHPQKCLLPYPHCAFHLGSVSKFMYEFSAFEHLCMPNESPVCIFTLSDIFFNFKIHSEI